MFELTKRPKLVGSFIRQRRETLRLSQRALGLLFSPPVTTQFISNVERGVTPLPPAHVPTLSKALQTTEAEIMALLEREYTLKLSGRLGKTTAGMSDVVDTGSSARMAVLDVLSNLPVDANDFEFMKALYDAYQKADQKTKDAFATVCDGLLNLRKKTDSAPKSE